MRTLLCTLALVMAGCGHGEPEPDGSIPAVGTAAPSFRLQNQDGEHVAIGGAQDHWTIVTFFRAASTPW